MPENPHSLHLITGAIKVLQINVGFVGTSKPISGTQVTARDLHGVLLKVLADYDPAGAMGLHHHQTPKPYSLVPLYDVATGDLIGLRLNALTKSTAVMMYKSWLQAHHSGRELRLGRQFCRVSEASLQPGPSFETLGESPPSDKVGLRFLSPTVFRQGAGYLPLPLPKIVFLHPFRVWNTFAPTRLNLPRDWLEWCAENVFVTKHEIETAQVIISQKEPPIVGFVGKVWFTARSDALLYLGLYQALASLVMYSGVGYKTTMGLGAVERFR